MFSHHVHLLVKVPPKVSMSKLKGIVEGRNAIQVFKKLQAPEAKAVLRESLFWAKVYCADTVGVDAEMIRKYGKPQEKQEKQLELPIQ